MISGSKLPHEQKDRENHDVVNIFKVSNRTRMHHPLQFQERKKRLYNFVIYFRYNLFRGCPSAKTVTLILRGGAEQFIEETERSLHDAIMIVRRALKVKISHSV